ncbi:bifunctional adenosylcobinamide kinase/adenosylcobinamide-phosphate guanylyltransferase [Synechocystis sp. LKSZ1]|uniref:bifunctional adenosylcobinamide kinase/adenosylcobinamide-phosphate guanylyltransferase n=1 Tax=Synechocystis sp. LKSZ1 TaxID=3144951 RepID=UPI00336BF827
MITLVTGPARSGKSEWAEQLATESSLPVIYLATAQEDPQDPDWQARLAAHRQRRPSHWQTWAIPTQISQALQDLDQPACILVDSLGTWVANQLDQSEAEWQSVQTEFLSVLGQCTTPVILVAEETGWGVIPAYPLGRQFRDRLGVLIRQVGALADEVYLVTGGYALPLSQWGQPLKPKNLIN